MRPRNKMMPATFGVLVAGAIVLVGSAAQATARQDANQPPQPSPTARANQAIRTYQDESATLPQQPRDPMHRAEVKALRSLASALEAIPNAPDQVGTSAKKIRDDASKIEDSAPTAVHSDWTKDALMTATDALDALRASSTRADLLRERVNAAKMAVGKIDDTAKFLKQRATIDSAFRKVGDALIIAEQGREAVSMAPPAAAPTAPPEGQRQPVAGREEELPPAIVVASPPSAPPSPGISISAGGGVVDFADNASKHLTKAGGTWDVRLLIGENTLLGGEIAYVGTANAVNDVMAAYAPNGTILGSALEGDLRLQLPRVYAPVRPFAFYGLGWNHFNLVNEVFRNPVAIHDTDDALVMPFGAGLQFDISRHVGLDTRFTYRAMFGESLLHTSNTGVAGVGNEGLSQWAVTARLGYTF